jgi:pimeloyl-ACP methyl ester carboxylesterase
MVDLGDRKLHLNCTGSGSPAVIVENGSGGFSVEWALVQPKVAKRTRICTYDRAGYAWSDRGPIDDGVEQIVSGWPFCTVSGTGLGSLHTALRVRRSLFFLPTLPGVSGATAMVYYLRSGIYLGPDLLSVIPTAKRIRVPVLMISGARDWIVPTARAQTILSAISAERKELVIIPNAVHDTTYSAAPALYASQVLSFLRTHVGDHNRSR